MVLNPIRSSPGMPILHFESSKVGWAFSKTRICAIYGYGLGSGKGTETLAHSKLESTIKAARDVAEAGAKAALEQLSVGQATPDSHLSEAERSLRRRLSRNYS